MDNNPSMIEPKLPQTIPGQPAFAPNMQGIPGVPELASEKKKVSIVEVVILVTISLIAVAGIILSVVFYMNWNEAQSNLDGKIEQAVEIAKEETRTEMENNFAEREKQPYLEFTGPIDYGAVSFVYPRTWSIYISEDATSGGNYRAYFNPGQINPITNTSINALRFAIIDQSIENVRSRYDNLVKNGKVSHSVFQQGEHTIERFDGELSDNIVGIVIMFKLNDKTVMFQTDAKTFQTDFDRLITTITTD